MNRREQLIAKIERALAKEGRLPEDPEKRQQAIYKQLKVFLKKLEVKEEAEHNVKARLKESYDTFTTKYTEWFIAHEKILKSLDTKKRQAELEQKQDELRKMLNIPKAAVKSIIEKIEAAAAKIEADTLPAKGVTMPTKFQFSTTKELSDYTKKTYASKLNKLAAAGYTTNQSLIDNQEAVNKIIGELIKKVPAEKQAGEARIYYSAIFAALHGDPILKTDNLLRRAFHTYRPGPPPDSDEGKKWKGFDEFMKKESSPE